METRFSNRPVTRQQTSRPTATVACEACRRLKMRCIRSYTQVDEPCDRCRRNHRPCRIPAPRPLGRKPGSVGRYHGLEKAYRKVQAELDKVRGSSRRPSSVSDGFKSVQEAERFLAFLGSNEPSPNNAQKDAPGYVSEQRSTVDSQDYRIYPAANANEKNVESPANQEPVHNPLALLADASEAAQSNRYHAELNCNSLSSIADSTPENSTGDFNLGSLLNSSESSPLGLRLSQETLETGLKALFTPTPEVDRYSNYFRSPKNVRLRDIGPDLDPVDLGLVTIEEANALFPIYFARLHPVNGILDPMLHTVEFVRSRSALLFTWILALTAQFEPDYVPMAKRLRLHGEKLSRDVHMFGFKSVEIVQGYYISLLSATPAMSLAEERSWLYTMYAFGIAAELGLDQGGRSEEACFTHSLNDVGQVQGSDTMKCGNGHGEMPSDNHKNQLDDDNYLQRLMRNRERTWLRILLWERANSAAYGRVNSFPETELTSSIEMWCHHPLADMTDKHTCAFILLRRNLAFLHTEITKKATEYHPDPHWVRNLVDTTLQPWRKSWLIALNSHLTPSEKLSGIFLYYVYLHNRLWTLSLALKNSTSREAQLKAVRNDCFRAAVECCEVAVSDMQEIGEPLYCMLAPTWAMISYAAVLSLKLFPRSHSSGPEQEVELLGLLGQVALQLERAGTTPPPRFGIAALLGRHLLMILRNKADSLRRNGYVLEVERAGVAVKQTTENQTTDVLSVSANPVDSPAEEAFISTRDPFLATNLIPMETDFPGDGFTDLFREIFGPGFADVF